jgi:hypothetical protein
MSDLLTPGYVPGQTLPHTVKNTSGYIENAFPGKEDQMVKVTEYLSEKAFIPADLAQNEVSWFYGYVYVSLGCLGCIMNAESNELKIKKSAGQDVEDTFSPAIPNEE